MPAESLPRARIIRRRAAFDAARLKGRRIASRWFALNLVPPGTDTAGAEVAFLTPKRLGAAAVRNRLRRRMREIYRRHFQRDDPRRPALVWIARPAALGLDFEELRARMEELLQRLG